MYIEVLLPRSSKKKRVQINDSTSIVEILQRLDIKPDTCLILIKNNPVPIDTIVEDGQTIKLIEVTSGG